MIISLDSSPKKNKRFRVYLDSNKYYDFGSPNANTFIDGASEQTKLNYQKRHYANKTEKYRIDNLIPSPSLFSYYVLWGPYSNINKNVKYLNKLMKKSKY
jgi:Family of unknown function (DUF5754)